MAKHVIASNGFYRIRGSLTEVAEQLGISSGYASQIMRTGREWKGYVIAEVFRYVYILFDRETNKEVGRFHRVEDVAKAMGYGITSLSNLQEDKRYEIRKEKDYEVD